MTFLPITSLFVAVSAVALVVLSLPVSLRRIKIDAPFGDARDETLRRRIRAQGNFVEYVPLSLITLGFVEASVASSWMIVTLGGALVAGRALHAVGMLGGSTPLRAGGMVLTYLSLLGGAFRIVINALH